MFFEYLKENPVLTAVLCAALAIIVIVIIALCVKSSKARKTRAETENNAARSTAGTAEANEVQSSETDKSEALAKNRSGHESAEPSESKTDEEDTAARESVHDETAEMKEFGASEVTTDEPKTDNAETETPEELSKQTDTAAEKGQTEVSPALSAQAEKEESGEKSVSFPETAAEAVDRTALPAAPETNKENSIVNEADVEKDIPKSEAGETEKNPEGAEKIFTVKEDAVQKNDETATETEKESGENAAEEKSAEKEKKKGKNKSKEGKMDIEGLRNAPIEEESEFYDEDDENDKIARYSGKWVICRVVTAGAKNSDEIKEDGDEMFFFELRASNGEKLLTSEEYTTYNGALNGIETHKANIERGNFKIMLSKKGDYIFKLLSGKNMLLCMGEHYATKARCESAIASAKRFAKTAIIDENVQDIVITPPPEEDDGELPEIPDNGYNGKWIIRAHTAEDGEQVFYFELFASNGEKLLSSEEYTTYIGAINGIGTHKTNIERGNFRISLTKRGDYIYKLLNGNGQLLCLGEHYKTKRRCENAIESVKRFAKNAPILSDSETVNKNA